MTSTNILIATTNRGKLDEVQVALAGMPLRLTSLHDHPPVPEPEEDAETFEGNARKKAQHYARLTGVWTLADDSGLQVDALGGAPGVRSARYAGPRRDDRANNAKLVYELAGVPPETRTARFYCAIVLADSARVLATATGTMVGLIITEPRGDNGFGYDPHFLVPERGLTTAQMSTKQKNEISHRGHALRAIRPKIEQLIADGLQ